MTYTSGSHTVFHHRYHIVWITKYRYKVLEGALRDRIRTIIRQVCKELGVEIVSGVLSKEHVHMFVEIPPRIAVSDFVRRVKGRSSHRVQMEFPELRKRHWGRHLLSLRHFRLANWCSLSLGGGWPRIRRGAFWLRRRDAARPARAGAPPSDRHRRFPFLVILRFGPTMELGRSARPTLRPRWSYGVDGADSPD